MRILAGFIVALSLLLVGSTYTYRSYLVKPVEFPAFVELVAQLGMYWAVMNRLPA
jgi:hypothetical protein